MRQQQNVQLSNREGRIQLALSAYTAQQFRSRQRAAEASNAPLTTLARRYNGIPHRLDTRDARRKLTTSNVPYQLVHAMGSCTRFLTNAYVEVKSLCGSKYDSKVIKQESTRQIYY
jgi:hypothetical protein